MSDSSAGQSHSGGIPTNSRGNDTSKYHGLPFVRAVCDYINTYFKKERIAVVYSVTEIKP